MKSCKLHFFYVCMMAHSYSMCTFNDFGSACLCSMRFMYILAVQSFAFALHVIYHTSVIGGCVGAEQQ